MSFNVIVESSILQDYVDTMQAFVDEATLEFTDEGIYSEAVDPANVGMVAQTLRPEATEAYETTGVSIGVNLERLSDFMGKANSGDPVHLSLNEETRRVNIEYGDVDVQMAGIDPDAIREGTTLPDSVIENLTSDVSMDSEAFKHAIDVAGMVTDQIRFRSNPDNENPLHILGEGDTDDARVKFSNALHEGSHIPEACESLFSEEYLQDVTGVMPNGADVRIQHGDEYPIKVSYEHPSGGVEVEFAVSPRIEDS